jgi:hypothetical protein
MAEWWETKPGDPPDPAPPIAQPEVAPGPTGSDQWWATKPAAPPPSQSYGDAGLDALAGVPQRGGSFATGANDLLATALGAPVDAASWLLNKASTGLTGRPLYTGTPVGGSESIRNLMGSTIGRTDPKDELDRLLYAGGQGTMAVPLAALGATAFGGAGVAPNTMAAVARPVTAAPLTSATVGMTGGETGQGARDAAAASGAPPLVQELAGFGGGLVGGTLPGALYGAATRPLTAVGAMTPRSTPMSQAYEATGITPATAADVTQNPLVQALATTAARFPGGGAIPAAVARTANQFGNAVENTAAKLGDSTTKIEAGTALQKSAQNYLDDWGNRQTAAWNGVTVPSSNAVDVNPIIQGLQLRLGRYPGAPKLAASQTNAELQKLYDDLVADAAPDGTLQWEAAKNLRSDIGKKIGVGAYAPDRDLAALNQVYGNLTDAMGDTATQAGAGPAFATARMVSKEGHDFLDNGGRAILNATPEGAVDKAFTGVNRGGGSTLTDIRATLPDAADELAAWHLRDLVTPPPGQASPSLTASPNSFLTGLDRLSRSPEALGALYGDPAVASDLSNLKTVADGIRATAQRLPNPSGTAGAVLHGELLSEIYRSYLQGGAVGALKAAAPIAANYGLARTLASPAGMRFMQGPQAAYPIAPTAAGRLGVVPQLIPQQ